ncbi:MAG: helix-turn-helix domain-containing protein [Syntrophales bacterium]|nr:helix-turn-helix domain-containing protein [Syntrophales bacterium]
MMKPYEQQNYYELLDIQPDASPFEIRRAFQENFNIYKPDSIVSYSFFTEVERKTILAKLEEAYLALMDYESRSAYDRKLIAEGIIEEGKQFKDKSRAPIPLYNGINRNNTYPQPSVPPHSNQQDPRENSAIQDLLGKKVLTGQDLKTVRIALGVTLDRIAQESKIKISILEAIENDEYDHLPPIAYLKGFIKIYARCLKLDDRIAQAYLKHHSP